MTLANNAKTTLYEKDYYLWLEQVAAQLRTGDLDAIDLENLIEEIEDLGRSEKRQISSYLMRLCEHLLKVKYCEAERESCFRGWDVEISNFRLQIQKRLKESPSLNQYLQEVYGEEYHNGRKLFLKASGLDTSTVPEEPVFTLAEAIAEDWLPWQPEKVQETS
jgi:hypothetical protein